MVSLLAPVNGSCGYLGNVMRLRKRGSHYYDMGWGEEDDRRRWSWCLLHENCCVRFGCTVETAHSMKESGLGGGGGVTGEYARGLFLTDGKV